MLEVTVWLKELRDLRRDCDVVTGQHTEPPNHFLMCPAKVMFSGMMQILTDATPPHLIGKVVPTASFCDRRCVQDTPSMNPNPLCKVGQKSSVECQKRKVRRWLARWRQNSEQVLDEMDLDAAMCGLSPTEQRLMFFNAHRSRGYCWKYIAALWKQHPFVVAREESRQEKKRAAKASRALRRAQRLHRIKNQISAAASNSK